MSVAHSFGVSGSSGILGSWLSSSTSSNTFTALAAKNSSTATSTAQALSGLIKPSQQRVISAVGDSTGPLSIPWNANGTEPTTVAALRTAGWLKLDKKVLTNGKPSGGTYELTKIGQAIYNRTDGGRVGSSAAAPLTSADTNGGSSTAASSGSSTAALQSTVSSLTSILGSVGVSV